MIESGHLMNLDEFEAFLRTLEGRDIKLKFELSDFNTKIVGDVAYTRYRSRTPRSEYLESVVLLRSGDQWLLDRVHSTAVKQSGP